MAWATNVSCKRVIKLKLKLNFSIMLNQFDFKSRKALSKQEFIRNNNCQKGFIVSLFPSQKSIPDVPKR